jgi:hypothetical protein
LKLDSLQRPREMKGGKRKKERKKESNDPTKVF